jgi:hypothetical protein
MPKGPSTQKVREAHTNFYAVPTVTGVNTVLEDVALTTHANDHQIHVKHR